MRDNERSVIVSLGLRRKVGGVEDQAHENATERASNGDGHDPSNHKQSDTLEVDSLESAVAKTNTNGSSSDAHGCRDGQLVLREDQDSDGSAHLHGTPTAGTVVGDLVAHDCDGC